MAEDMPRRFTIVREADQSRIDLDSLRETLRYIYDDLESERRLERVRLGIAIAIAEIDRAEDHRRSVRPALVKDVRFLARRSPP